MIKLSVNKTNCTGLDLDSLDFDLHIWFRARQVTGVKWYGHPGVLGIPRTNTLGIWVFPSRITFAIWVRARVTGDVHITRVSGMGITKKGGCPYYCDTGTFETRGPPRQWACFQHPSWRQQTRLSSFLIVHIFFASCKQLSWIMATAAWYFIVFL